MRIEARSFLSYLTDDLEAIAANSLPLWHPLGFVSCVVKEVKGDHTVRIHYWPPSERRVKTPHWPIHTHAYHLSSLVLAGTVRDIQYRKVSSDEYSLYSVKYSHGDSEILRTGQLTGIEIATELERTAGMQYEVSRGIFHQTEVAFDLSALTIVALSQFSSEAPLVLGNNQDDRYFYNRVCFDPSIFWDEVRKVLIRTDCLIASSN